MSISAKLGVGSLRTSQTGQQMLRVEREGWAHPFMLPIHAPVADPGFTKKRPSYSTAWKL